MTQPITHIIIAGVSYDLADVEYQIQVTHGRNDVKSQPEASTAQIIILGSTGLDVNISDSVDVTAWTTRRFTGEVTDIAITHAPATPPLAITTITCVGNLSNLGARWTGEDGYPIQTVYERVGQILTDSGESYLNGGTQDLDLYTQIAGSENAVTCTEGLQNLAEWSGGTFFDLPDGRVVFESYGVRGLTAFAGVWSSLNQPWGFYERAWDSFPTSFAAVPIPTGTVVYTPNWAQNQTSIINDVTVTHGVSASPHQGDDPSSIAIYGRRAYTLTTGLKANQDAIDRVNSIILAQAYPLWNLGNISIIMDELTEPQRDQIMGLVSGSSVVVSDLPQPAPFEQFLGIVEGWSETYTPGQHLLTLSISDPRYSYQTATWSEVNAALTWAAVNPTIIWYNVVTADDLIAA